MSSHSTKKRSIVAPCPSAYIPRGAIKREEAKGSEHSPSPPKISECTLNHSLWLIIMVATAGQGEEKHDVQQESRLAWSSAV